MPVRSLNSPVLRWPEREKVKTALRSWAEKTARTGNRIQRIGCFGSLVSGNWGVGSDLDIIIMVKNSDTPFEKRSREFDTSELPVEADVVVLTEQELKDHPSKRFKETLTHQTWWIVDNG
jgi:predicted nucleotidyltransferase